MCEEYRKVSKNVNMKEYMSIWRNYLYWFFYRCVTCICELRIPLCYVLVVKEINLKKKVLVIFCLDIIHFSMDFFFLTVYCF